MPLASLRPAWVWRGARWQGEWSGGGAPGGGGKGGAVKGGGAEKGAGGPTTAERTEGFQQLQGDYPLGSLVEIEQRDDGFQGAWFEASFFLKKAFFKNLCFRSRSHSNLPQMSHSPFQKRKEKTFFFSQKPLLLLSLTLQSPPDVTLPHSFPYI